MNRDDYVMMKERQEIVTAFINKLEKTEVADVSLIPSLYEFVITGDRAMFDEFNKFRSMKEAEERALYAEKEIKYFEELIEEYKKRLPELVKTKENYHNVWQKTREEFQHDCDEVKRRLWDVRNKLDDTNPCKEIPTMEDLISFCQRVSKDVGKHRKLWMKCGDTLKSIKRFIIIDNGKAVFEVESEDLKKPCISVPIPNIQEPYDSQWFDMPKST